MEHHDFFFTDLGKPPIFTDKEYFQKKYVFDLSNEVVPQERQKAKITLFEQNLLRLIARQQALSLDQLYRIYNAYFPIKYKTLRMKLNRWGEKKILHVRRPSIKNAMMLHNIYSIGKVGLKILAIEDGEEWLEVNNNLFKEKTNYTHGIGQQEVVVQLMLHYMKHNIHFESIAPYSLFGVDKSLGIPDWFLKYRSDEKNEHNLFIEFDANSEKLNALNDKHKAYIQRAIENPDENITVLYSLIDEEFHYRILKPPSGPKRVSNFKSYFAEPNIVLPKNLTINVHYLNRVGPATEYLFLPQDIKAKLNILEKHFVNEFHLNVDHVLSKDFYMQEIPKEHYADGIWELRNTEGLLEERILVVVAQEGDIRSFQRIDSLFHAIKKRRLVSTVHRLVIIYNDDISSLSDSHGTKFDRSVLTTDVESLVNKSKKPFRSFYGVFKTKQTEYPLEKKE
ncbi:replication-relaxation family protein [Oceanobacillus luteolus]|uniref:Replication-relaxation family protein n=1 Tax=Oceanobacillus luteolus TaxID=1274358 RepID=A0ABW4HXG8_9BACI